MFSKVYYIIKKGDNLYDISQKFYGRACYWRTIYYANRKALGDHPNILVPGQIIRIPSRWWSAARIKRIYILDFWTE